MVFAATPAQVVELSILMFRIAINAVSISPGGGLSVLKSLLEYWSKNHLDLYFAIFASDPAVIGALAQYSDKAETFSVCVNAGSARHFAFQQLALGQMIRDRRADVVLSTNHMVGRCSLPQVVHHQNLLRFQHSLLKSAAQGRVSDFARDIFARRALRFADANVFISDFVRKQASNFVYGGNVKNSYVVYNAIMPVPSRSDPNVGRKLGQLLAVQSDCTYKNGDVLIKAVKLLIELAPEIDWRLKFAGSGAWNSLKRLSVAEGVGDRVEFLGFADRAKLKELYDSSSILLFPSSVEGFGLPVLEAMHHSVPVIAANSTAIPEVAGDAALLVSPKSPLAYAKAVISIEMDKTLRSNIVSKGLKRSGLFTPSIQAESMLKVLKSVTSS
jgi:glycosyltransferase involved in cell wall biosynthesis